MVTRERVAEALIRCFAAIGGARTQAILITVAGVRRLRDAKPSSFDLLIFAFEMGAKGSWSAYENKAKEALGWAE